MELVHLNQKQLAARWDLSEATLERWRHEGLGPTFLKLYGKVLYRQVDVDAYEESCLRSSTASKAVTLGRKPNDLEGGPEPAESTPCASQVEPGRIRAIREASTT